MLGKIINETFTKVRHKADDIRLQISTQTAKAKDLLGIGHLCSIQELEQELESCACQVASTNSLRDLSTRWVDLILLSDKPNNSVRYYDLEQLPSSSIIHPSSNYTISRGHSYDRTDTTEFAIPYSHHRLTNLVLQGELDHNVSSLIQNAGLSFKQVFLKSDVIEKLLIRLSLDVPEVSRELLTSSADDNSCFFTFMGLLGIVLDGDPTLHRDLVFFMFSAEKKDLEDHFSYALELLDLLKKSWKVEVHAEAERCLRILSDTVCEEIRGTNELVDSETNDRITQQALYVKTHLALHVVLNRQLILRKERVLRLQDGLDKLKKTLEATSSLHEADGETSKRSVDLQNGMAEESEECLGKVAGLESERDQTKAQLETLIHKRGIILQELDEINSQIGITESILDKIEYDIRGVKTNLDEIQIVYKRKLASEGRIQQHMQRQKLSVDGLISLTNRSHTHLVDGLAVLQVDSNVSCCAQNKAELSESVETYLRIQKERLISQSERIKKLVAKSIKSDGSEADDIRYYRHEVSKEISKFEHIWKECTYTYKSASPLVENPDLEDLTHQLRKIYSDTKEETFPPYLNKNIIGNTQEVDVVRKQSDTFKRTNVNAALTESSLISSVSGASSKEEKTIKNSSGSLKVEEYHLADDKEDHKNDGDDDDDDEDSQSSESLTVY